MNDEWQLVWNDFCTAVFSDWFAHTVRCCCRAIVSKRPVFLAGSRTIRRRWVHCRRPPCTSQTWTPTRPWTRTPGPSFVPSDAPSSRSRSGRAETKKSSQVMMMMVLLMMKTAVAASERKDDPFLAVLGGWHLGHPVTDEEVVLLGEATAKPLQQGSIGEKEPRKMTTSRAWAKCYGLYMQNLLSKHCRDSIHVWC